jgi:hypothetical protein
MERRRKQQTSEMPTEYQQKVSIGVFLSYGYTDFAYDINGVDVYVVDNKKYIKVQQVVEDCGI